MRLASIAAFNALLGLAFASPMNDRRHARYKRMGHLQKREVPQEHSHDFVLTITREFLNLDNPKGIVDVVFGLLGNAAAAAGAGDVTNLDCLKQETADQAFTNAKAAKDLRGMAGALLFQAIERNTGGVGVASVLCTEKAVNPEIAALTQHQDPASDNAGALNKAITLELAKQLAGIGADTNLALLSGTFAAGDVRIYLALLLRAMLIDSSLMTTPARATLATMKSPTWVASTPRVSLFSTLQRLRSPPLLPMSPRPSQALAEFSQPTSSTWHRFLLPL